jgi:hypothetical protein
MPRLFLPLLVSLGLLAPWAPLQAAGGPAAPVERTRNSLGSTLKFELASAPFPNAARQNGYRYADLYYPPEDHYSDASVEVFVPAGFRPGSSVDLVFFFHGWYSSIDEAERGFQLTRQFAESGVNALLVLPETARRAPDSFGGNLEEAGGFARLVTELLGRLQAARVIGRAKPGRIVLAGHSGAYRLVSQVLERGGLEKNIREVYLFDALYDFEQLFAEWIEAGERRFVSLNVIGSETAAAAERLIGLLRRAGVHFTVGSDEQLQGGPALGSRVLFLRSSYDHYGVVSGADQFGRILRSSPQLAHQARLQGDRP